MQKEMIPVGGGTKDDLGASLKEFDFHELSDEEKKQLKAQTEAFLANLKKNITSTYSEQLDSAIATLKSLPLGTVFLTLAYQTFYKENHNDSNATPEFVVSNIILTSCAYAMAAASAVQILLKSKDGFFKNWGGIFNCFIEACAAGAFGTITIPAENSVSTWLAGNVNPAAAFLGLFAVGSSQPFNPKELRIWTDKNASLAGYVAVAAGLGQIVIGLNPYVQAGFLAYAGLSILGDLGIKILPKAMHYGASLFNAAREKICDNSSNEKQPLLNI